MRIGGLEDTSLHYAEMFQLLAFAFDNESIQVSLLEDAYDLPLIEEIDPIDPQRIRIIRGYKLPQKCINIPL